MGGIQLHQAGPKLLQCALGCGHQQGVVGGSSLRNVGDDFALRPPYLVVEVVVLVPTEEVLQILSGSST